MILEEKKIVFIINLNLIFLSKELLLSLNIEIKSKLILIEDN